MAESTRLVDLVSARIDRALDEQRDRLAAISPDLLPFDTFARDLLAGGKRFRALFCYWGWQSVAGRSGSFDPLSEGSRQTTAEAVVTAAAALEVFHAAALVHDDIMDRSDTRRGRPAAHRRYESLHAESGWVGDRALYGTNAALLLGDLLLSLSDAVFDEALALLDPVRARIVRQEFHAMRLEVTAGQYLDIHEETAWPTVDDAEQLVRAQRVIVFKSAKYSVEAPLLIGALIAGASANQLDGLRSFGLPLGVAYQLRDDMLGVFGDPEVTGKPAGDDLREGKRTVLVATARKALPVGARQLLDELLGDPDLDDDQVQMLRATLTESGAVGAVERSIDRHVQRAKAALDAAPLSPSARDQLAALADTVSNRSA
ncbi:polyprenyl synthetase family protein [Curtobacterium sp. MCBD17_032]|uniref:polyprenyl synthetase family protein n=1 Tax=Curtobacterium sp. MCBD17_032 TaxID=2175659 RepID=UPI000DAA58C7|nr:polyprenyl synthetase family protein [Curtobacterium sp. MCBD17_032]PZE80051.1 polyprenyl synthetase family protein [Curtobacterium sp. MCBD17_032]